MEISWLCSDEALACVVAHQRAAIDGMEKSLGRRIANRRALAVWRSQRSDVSFH